MSQRKPEMEARGSCASPGRVIAAIIMLAAGLLLLGPPAVGTALGQGVETPTPEATAEVPDAWVDAVTWVIPFAQGQPALDGDIGEWSGLAPGHVDKDHAGSISGEVPAYADLSADVWLAWTADRLFLAARITDDVLVGNNSAQIWGDDVLELGLAIGAGDQVHQLTFALDGRVTDNANPISTVAVVSRTVAGGWSFEAAIPAATLGVAPFTSGQQHRGTFALWDDDRHTYPGQTHLFWQSNSTNALKPDWATLSLTGQTYAFGGTPTPTPTVTVTPVPGDGNRFVYVEDFTTERAREMVDHLDWDTSQRELRMALQGIKVDLFAVAPDGSRWIVWEERTAVWIARFDRQGNRSWQTPALAVPPAINQTPLFLAADPTGGVLLIWKRGFWDGPAYDTRAVLVQRFDADGRARWAQPVALPKDAHGAAGVVDTHARTTLTWSSGEDRKIMLQRVDGAGTAETAREVTIPNDFYALPKIILDQQETPILFWNDRNHIYGYCAGSCPWTYLVQVDNSLSSKSDPVVRLTTQGRIVVAWLESRTEGGPWDVGVFAKSLATNVSENPADQLDVRVGPSASLEARGLWLAADSDGGVRVFWYDELRGSVVAQRLNASLQVQWPGDIPLPLARQQLASADLLDGQATVSFLGCAGQAVCTQTMDMDGRLSPLTSFVPATGNGKVNQENVAAAQGIQDDLFVFWAASVRPDAPDQSHLEMMHATSTGARLWLRTGGYQARYLALAAAAGADGSATLCTSDRRLQRVDASGNELWPEIYLPEHTAGAGQAPEIAVDALGNTVLTWVETAWVGDDVVSRLYARRLDGAGNTTWSNDLLLYEGWGSAWDGGVALDHDLVIAPDGRFVVAYGGESPLTVRLYNPSGQQLWQTVLTTNGIGWDAHVEASINAGSELFVAWKTSMQKLTLQGNTVWPAAVTTSAASGSANYYYRLSAIASRAAGQGAWVMWRNHDAKDAGVYVQHLNGAGQRDFATDQRMGDAYYLYTPTLFEDRDGHASVVWNELGDVYLQKLVVPAGALWAQPVELSAPDRYYYEHGFVTSRNVSAATREIQEATLTGVYASNGGDLRFFLSNNGGGNWFPVTPGISHRFATAGAELRWRVEMATDLLRPRTPIISSLRIEYSTESPYADDYEPDDACEAARPIAVNGAAQSHTFHQQGDADWAWFDAVAGATYVLETRNTGAQANSIIEPHRTCDAPGTPGGRSFGSGYTLSFTAPATGRHYLKVYNHNAVAFGPETAYTLSVRAVQPAAVALIVAGHDNVRSAEDNILYAADRAYRVFRNAGLPTANIRYLAPVLSRDADGDGQNDVAGPPTVSNVRDAVQDWARERGVALNTPFYLYLVDHGLVDRFKADGDAAASQISAADLNLWLSNLEATSGADNLNVIIDACYSGSFIDITGSGPASISGRNRVVISSTTSDWQAFGPAGGEGLYFSNAFFSALENEQSLHAAFLTARQAVEAQDLLQRPWFDDNGDQRFDTSDGALASARALKRVTLAGRSPAIRWVRGDLSRGTIVAAVEDDSPAVLVEVEVFAPSYAPPSNDGSGTTRLVQVPTVRLGDSDGDGVYTGAFAFTEAGPYRLVAHARDGEGNLALPVTGGTSAGGGAALYLPMVVR